MNCEERVRQIRELFPDVLFNETTEGRSRVLSVNGLRHKFYVGPRGGIDIPTIYSWPSKRDGSNGALDAIREALEEIGK